MKNKYKDCAHEYTDETIDEEGYSTCIYCGVSEKNRLKVVNKNERT